MKNRYASSDSVRNPKLIALSFFSGAMGFDLGIEKAGFEIKLCCEKDKYCSQTIKLNKPNIALIGDICEYSAQDVRTAAGLTKDREIDLVVGGPPCQSFSTAGARKGLEQKPNKLTPISEIICGIFINIRAKT